MAKWSEGSLNDKLGMWFADTQDIKEFKQQINQALDHLIDKYENNPQKGPIFVVLDITKFVPPQNYLSN